MRRLAVTALLVALVAGCSLPIPAGVHVHEGTAVEEVPGDIQVLPPGPRPGATAEAVVRGFLGAESSPSGGHAIARRFLAGGVQWFDDQVRVYDPASLRSGSNAIGSVQVTFSQLARIDSTGRYVAERPHSVTETYRLRQNKAGEWRIVTPPAGLRLSPADRERSFPAHQLYFIRSSPPAFRVVPDQVLLPADGATARVALERLLSGPSVDLAGSATSAFPAGTRLLSVSDRGTGIYDVALSHEAARANDTERQQLSAQVLWTLRDVDPQLRGLRLQVDGKPLAVPGEGEVQRRDDWNAFDPEGLAPGPAFFVSAGRVLTLAGSRTGRPRLPVSGRVDQVAVSPDRQRTAVLSSSRGVVAVRVTAAPGSPAPLRLSAPGLHSPSWGSGDRGLWLLDGAGAPLLLPASGRVVRVGVTPAGPLSALQVSRDGTRAAVVRHGSLLVGRVQASADRVQILDLHAIAPSLTRATAVVWRDPTTLVALGSLSQTFVPVLVSVDGSSLHPLPVAGLPAQPEQIASSSLGTIVADARRLFIQDKLGFRAGPLGAAPAYPG